MMGLVGNELYKLRTIRSPWLLVAIQQVVVVAGISGLAIDVDKASGAQRLVAHAGVASALLTLVLGITAVAGEYRHKSITDTYIATPRRARVIGAKLVAFTLVGALLGLVSAVNGVITTSLWLAGKGIDGNLMTEPIGRALIGIVAYNALFAAIGVSLGALIRDLTGAVAVALSWIALFETTVANLVKDVAQWLPNRSGMALDYMPLNSNVLSQWAAGLVLAGYALLFALIAIFTTVRRDVT
jgi:ABC-2 type transport system permease protein